MAIFVYYILIVYSFVAFFCNYMAMFDNSEYYFSFEAICVLYMNNIYILYDICFGKMMNNDDQINWFSVRLRYPLLPSGSGTRPATSGTTAGELVTAGGGAIWGCGMGR
jgi:hypothetical protein